MSKIGQCLSDPLTTEIISFYLFMTASAVVPFLVRLLYYGILSTFVENQVVQASQCHFKQLFFRVPWF